MQNPTSRTIELVACRNGGRKRTVGPMQRARSLPSSGVTDTHGALVNTRMNELLKVLKATGLNMSYYAVRTAMELVSWSIWICIALSRSNIAAPSSVLRAGIF